jgi:Zn-dependent M28 family amino/carboxypeptidase
VYVVGIINSAVVSVAFALVTSLGASSTPAVAETSSTGSVDASRMVSDLKALEAVADANGGSRSTGTEGFRESLDYVESQLDKAGIEYREAPFTADSGEQGTNLIADIPGTDPDRVVILGAHLDSAGTPGVADNGAGVASLLEIGRILTAQKRLKSTVRLAFWDNEESGAWGSRTWIEDNPSELTQLVAYLNADQIAVKDSIVFVQDGDYSTVPDLLAKAPPDQVEEWREYFDRYKPAPGSDLLEKLLTDSLRRAGQPVREDPIFTESDTVDFVTRVPTGGILTLPTDGPHGGCIHEACDRLGNVDMKLLPKVTKAYLDTVRGVARQ